MRKPTFFSSLGELAYSDVVANRAREALSLADEAIAHAPDQRWLYGNRDRPGDLDGRQGRTESARTLLRPVFDKFGEGLDTSTIESD